MRMFNRQINLKSFSFEVLIIFAGITISFLFDEWRDSRELNNRLKQKLVLVRNDLIEFDSAQKKLDTLLFSFKNSFFDKLKTGQIKSSDSLLVAFALTSQLSGTQDILINVKRIFASSEFDQIGNVKLKNLIEATNARRNRQIEILEKIHNINIDTFYPLMAKYNVFKDYSFADTNFDAFMMLLMGITFDKTGDYNSLVRDKDFKTVLDKLEIIQKDDLKVYIELRQLTIELKTELDKELKEL